MKLYLITFTQDRGITFKTLSIPARNLTDAYIETQIRFPNAEITGAELTGKMLTFGNMVWMDILAEHLVKHATIEEVRETMALCDADMRQDLTDALWKLKRKN